jgi:hypothetical protein
MKKILFMILVVMVALASCDVMPQISDIDGDGIADLDDRLVGTWDGNDGSWYAFDESGNFSSFPHGNGTWQTRLNNGSTEINISSNGNWLEYNFRSELDPQEFDYSVYTYTKR